MKTEKLLLSKELSLINEKIEEIQNFSIPALIEIYNYCIKLTDNYLSPNPNWSSWSKPFYPSTSQKDYLFLDICLNYISSHISNAYRYNNIKECVELYDPVYFSRSAADTTSNFKYHIKEFRKNSPELYDELLNKKAIISTGKHSINICDMWIELIYIIINDYFQGNLPILCKSNFNDAGKTLELFDMLAEKASNKSLFYFHIEKKYSLTLYLDILDFLCMCYENKTKPELISAYLSNLKYLSLINLPNYQLFISNLYKQLFIKDQDIKSLDLPSLIFPTVISNYLFTYALGKLDKKFSLINNENFLSEIEKKSIFTTSYSFIYNSILDYNCSNFIQEISQILAEERKLFINKNPRYFSLLSSICPISTQNDLKKISNCLNIINMQADNSISHIYHLETRIKLLYP